MAQDLEQIIDILREIRNTSNTNNATFDRLLNSLNNKVETIDKNTISVELIKSYLTDLAKSVDNKYSTTIDKFTDIEHALKAIFNNQDDNVKLNDLRDLFESFSQNLSNFSVEIKQQKAIITSIESKISEMSNDKSDKEDILRTITLLRNDFENLNHGYKDIIDHVSSELKTIISNITKIDQSAINKEMKEGIDSMYKAAGDIINYLKAIDKHETNLETLLQNTATSDGLKITQAAVDSIIAKTTHITEQIENLYDESATKEQFKDINKKAEDLTLATNDVKETLARITKDIDSLPDTSVLKDSIQHIYNKINEIDNSITVTQVKGDVKELQNNMTGFLNEITTIKNIIVDLNEIVSSKLLSAVEDISFEQESFEIKDHISKMLAKLPQKEDIDRILENGELSIKSIEKLSQKTDNIADMLDNLPTHADLENLNTNQISLVENLQGIANKGDIEALTSKADEIEKMIDKLNFDNEFEHIYDKSASIEKWLIDSNVKENTDAILRNLDDKAEQKEVLEVLKTAEIIVNNIEELSKNVDVKKVNRTVAEVYQLIEDLKNDFLNTAEMHNDTVIVNLSELQKSIEGVVTGEEFENFVEDLKDFVDKTGETINNNNINFDAIREYQESIINKIDDINTSAIEEAITQKVSSLDDKLVSISEYLTTINKTDTNEVKKAISEIKELLANKKSNIGEIDNIRKETIQTLESYLREIKLVLDTSDKDVDDSIKTQIIDLEEKFGSYQVASEKSLTEIIDKLEKYQSELSTQNTTKEFDYKNSIDELSLINEKIQELSNSFNALNTKNAPNGKISEFVADKLDDISSNLNELSEQIETGMQAGFSYTSQLVEEKIDAIADFIKDLRHENTQDIELYERLTVADNKLIDIKQSIEWLDSDIINNNNNQAEMLLKEIYALKTIIGEVSDSATEIKNLNLKQSIEDFHSAVSENLEDVTKYSKSTYDKLENTYKQITSDLATTENNLRDFILSDIDSVLMKVDAIKDEVTIATGKLDLPDANQMKEFRSFIADIAEFKKEQQEAITTAAEDIKTTISDKLDNQHEEIKSLLKVAANTDEILTAIDSLKECFKDKIQEFEDNEDSIFDNFDSPNTVPDYDYEKQEKIVEELKSDFDKFAELITFLTGENSEIYNTLHQIKNKMNSISVYRPDVATSDIIERIENSDNPEIEIQNLDNEEQNKTLIGDDNFDFIKAFNLLQQDIEKLKNKVTKVIPNTQEAGEKELAQLSQVVQPDSWLEDVKNYISSESGIKSMLEEINEKIDSFSESDGLKWVGEIKQSLEQLAGSNLETTTPEIQTMLNLINEKIDILASVDEYGVVDEVREAIESLDIGKTDEETSKILNLINTKLDVLAETDLTNDFDEIKDAIETNATNLDDIKYTLANVDEKVDNVSKLSESDALITSMLEDLNHKIDNIVHDDNEVQSQDFQDIKELIMAQTDYIESLEKSNKTEAVRKCLQELTAEVNSLNSTGSTKSIQKTIKEMKTSIMEAVISIFNQVSFVEESEDIKDFVEEKTDAINKSLVEVTKQLKQITNANEEPDYTYSMQDIESDLAKMRLALNELQTNEQENHTTRLTSIIDNLAEIGSNVENLQNSLTQEEVFGMKSKFEKINEDINELIVRSGESYEVIANNLTTKVDKVTKMLEKSNDSDKVMRQALIYMGEWIDSASNSINRISSNSDEIIDVKLAIENLKQEVPTQTNILNTLGEKFDEQQERLAFFEKQITKISGLQDKFEEQQERIDRLEMTIEKILSAVEDIDDSKVTRKIDKIDKQIAKLSSNIEKLASYVD